MRERGLSPFGRADLHPRSNPLDRQGRFAPQPGSDGQLAGAATPASGPLGLLPGSPPRLGRFLVDGLQAAPFRLPIELLTPHCGVLPNGVLAQQAVHAHGARHEPNHVRPPPASQTPETASPPLPPLSGRFTRTNPRFSRPSPQKTAPQKTALARIPRPA